jgi:hypothetical protein
MNDPDLQSPLYRRTAGRLRQEAGPSPDDHSFDAFQSEDAAGRQPSAPQALLVVDLAEWCDDDESRSVFPSEAPKLLVRSSDDVLPAAPAPVVRVITDDLSERSAQRTFGSAVMLGLLVFVVGAGGSAAVTMFALGKHRASVPLAAAAPPAAISPAVPATTITAAPREDLSLPADARPLPVEEPALPAEEPVAMPNRSPGEPPLRPAPIVAAALPPLRQTTPDRGAALTTSVRGPAAEPSRITTATPVPLARDSAPPAALPGITTTAITPEVASAGGVAPVPGAVATVGALPLAATPNAASPPGPSTLVATTAVIESVLSRYAAAFTARDVAAARAVWPGLNERGLIRAFESVEEQQFDLGDCVITATPPRAVASCDGTAQYVPKVGSKRVRSEPRHWTFHLQQRGEGWSIEAVDFR